MNDPRMLYKHPGPHDVHGDKFDHIVVPEEHVDMMILAGWRKTTTEAKALSQGEKETVTDDDAQPTRAEVQAQADELGIKYTSKTSTAKLLEAVNARMI